MKKMCVLSLVLLMSLIHADTSKVTINNTSDSNLYVEVHYHATETGKNQSTGQAATVCGNDGYDSVFVQKGKSTIITNTICLAGVGVTVYATSAPNQKTAAITLTHGGTMGKYKTTKIGDVSNKDTFTITVSGQAGKYTVK